MAKIKDIPGEPGEVVYRRKDGAVYAKLNNEQHIAAVPNPDGSVLTKGEVETMDPEEDVEPLRP